MMTLLGREMHVGRSRMTDRLLVAAREARAVEVPAGTAFRVVDVEGGQVADLFAYITDNVREYASAEHTRTYVNRLFPRLGEMFVTNARRPILTFEEDASPGRYRLMGVEEPHASCEENLRLAMTGLGYPDVEVPQPINLFMNVRVDADGRLTWGRALTRPGDHVVLRAMLDSLIVVSACPQDQNEINGFNPTGLAIEMLG
jgi:uncharacterized protein YcgI (DUF1989 family)